MVAPSPIGRCPRGRGVAFAMVLVVLAVGACSTESAFRLRNGKTVSGRVVASEPARLEIATSRGRTVWVQRGQVESIDWAGEWASFTGGSLVIGGLVTLIATVASNSPGTEGFEPEGFTTGMALTGVLLGLGLGPLIWGLFTTEEAVSTVEAGLRPPKVTVAPMLQLGRSTQNIGGQLGVRF